MITKKQFQEQIAAEISNYPTAALFYQAKDPRLLAQLDAQAAMLSMLSAEMDVASMEPFTKARDVTVLADASVKGVLPFGTPTKVDVSIQNATATPFNVNAGRVLLDTQGRTYVVETGATIPANGSATVTAVQQSQTSFNHTVSVSQAFYQIQVPQPEAGRKIVSVAVKLGTQTFDYIPDFVNVEVGQTMFHLLTDEQRQMFIEFGATDIAGYQPNAGDVFTVTVTETEGYIELATGSLFAFEYSVSLYEAGSKLTLVGVVQRGADPIDIRTMREIANYPSIYDTSAVYLGNFDFLVRRNLSPFRFLSIWNEQIEESVRGPNIDNINTLFVAAKKDGVTDPVLQDQIAAVIEAADDSYKLSFVTVVNTEIPVAIVAKVPAIYDFVAVEQQIREIVIDNYGPDSEFSKRGQNRVLYKSLYDLLVANVQALQGASADIEIAITDPVASIMPEDYRYVSNASLTITVEQAP